MRTQLTGPLPGHSRLAVTADGLKRWIRANWPDALAGLVGAVPLIANMISFGALMFPGALSAGIAVFVWAMLIGSCICGLSVARGTTIPPAATGIDAPTGAALVVFCASIGTAALATGASPASVINLQMICMTLITILSGVLLYVLGRWRCGSYFRFVPSFVIGGFLGATGWLMVAGSVRMTTGLPLSLSLLTQGLTGVQLAKLVSAGLVLVVLLQLRQRVKWAYAMPAAIIGMWLLGNLAIRVFSGAYTLKTWYLPSMGTLIPWTPFSALWSEALDWTFIGSYVPEMLTIIVVTLISLVAKVSSLEVTRQTAGDLDAELSSHGIGTLLSVPAGGLLSGVQIGTSRLLEQVGSVSRWSGAWCAAVLGLVGLTSFDLPGLVPVPLLGGLVFYLGYLFLADALWKPWLQRAWVDLLLTLAILFVCVRFGYLAGVVSGVMAACLIFVVNYARLGAIRQHASRTSLASHVERSTESADHLSAKGEAIQIYWLSGYMFFGSSEGVFERIKADIEARPPQMVKYVLLDFRQVTGADSSAVFSLVKLRNYVAKKHVALVYSGLSAANRTSLERGGFLGKKDLVFAEHDLALAWCEDQVLAASAQSEQADATEFGGWLQKQLGDAVSSADLLAYFKRRRLEGSQVLYVAGDAADSVDLVAAGSLTVEMPLANGENQRLRRFVTHTVIGEMGFFRGLKRVATVRTEGPVELYTMTRVEFQRMKIERPELAHAFDAFIICVLADRLEFSSRAAGALVR
jgi:sulfate permease, SulP family